MTLMFLHFICILILNMEKLGVRWGAVLGRKVSIFQSEAQSLKKVILILSMQAVWMLLKVLKLKLRKLQQNVDT